MESDAYALEAYLNGSTREKIVESRANEKIARVQSRAKLDDSLLPAWSTVTCAFAKGQYSCRVPRWRRPRRRGEPPDPIAVCHGQTRSG